MAIKFDGIVISNRQWGGILYGNKHVQVVFISRKCEISYLYTYILTNIFTFFIIEIAQGKTGKFCFSENYHMNIVM